MTQEFSGTVLLPGETGEGLYASFEMDDVRVRLIAAGDEIGSWDRADCDVIPSGKGSFQLDLAGEGLMFTPTSPSAFAETMSVPLSPEPHVEVVKEEKPQYDYDAAIDDIPTKPRSTELDDDGIISKGMLVGIVGLSAAMMTGLVVASVML